MGNELKQESTGNREYLAGEQLQIAFEASGIATWQFDLKRQILEYSANFEEVTGCNPTTASSFHQLRELVHPEDYTNLVEPVKKKALATGLFKLDLRLLHDQRWVRCTGKIVQNSQGNPARLVGTIINISEEKEKSRLDAQLSALVNFSQDAIISKTLEGRILSWNKSAERIFGYTTDEMIGNSILVLFPPDRLQEEEHILKKIMNGEFIDHFETQRLTKDGRLLDLSLSISPVRDASGKITSVSKIARDITSQKNAERLIAQSEQRQQIVLDASGLGMWELHPHTKKIAYSDSYLKMLGYKDGAGLTPEKLKSHVHPDDLHIRERAFAEADKTGELHYQFRMIRVDKVERWLEVRGKAFFDDQGRAVKYVGAIRDITDDRLNTDRLRESEKKFRVLANSMPQFVWTADSQGSLNYFNQSVFDYSGFTADDLFGEGWLKIVHPDDRERNISLWLKAINTGEPFICEHRFRRSDGTYRWQLSRAVPQRDPGGSIVMWIGTSTDVHDQKSFSEELEKSVTQRTAELKNAVDELTRINHQLEQFAYISSHDLQEPLRKIQTFAGLLTDKMVDQSPQSKLYLEKIQSSASRMSGLVQDLLKYSRIDNEHAEFSDVDLNLIFHKTANDLELIIEEKNATLTCEKLPVVRGVPTQLNQLFHNLIGNALKFSLEEPVIRITYREDAAPPAVIKEHHAQRKFHCITVTDNGIGFSPEYSERIFTIFQRLNNRDQFEGTGIGLAICKRIVDKHMGYIDAKSEEGKGASFRIYLPI